MVASFFPGVTKMTAISSYLPYKVAVLLQDLYLFIYLFIYLLKA